jgi:4-amino-4-deoxy-L-arabinose transferase-like glycosyltransferase
MVWLIAMTFEILGVNLISLRLPSVAAAWVTVAVLQEWTRRCFGSRVALIASLVLATTFGFVHVHAGRSAATDALFTLFTLLTVVTLWAEETRPTCRLWLGPLLAGTFLLRGMAVLLPLAIVAIVTMARPQSGTAKRLPTLGALALFLLIVAPWAIGRYHFDGLVFFRRMVVQDFITRTLWPIELHEGGPLYYVNILLKHHYDWMLAGVMAALSLRPWRRLRHPAERAGRAGTAGLVAAWTVLTFLVPTVMQTKTPWYLTTFYPAFAVLLALWLTPALIAAIAARGRDWRAAATIATFLLAIIVAEARLLSYSAHYRDLGLSEQSLLLTERHQLRGRRVYMHPLARANHFVTEAVVGAFPKHAVDCDGFVDGSRDGDYWLSVQPCAARDVEMVRTNGRQYLYQRRVCVSAGRTCRR